MQLWIQVQPMEKEASDLCVEVSTDASAQSLVDALAQHLDGDGGGRAALYSPRSGAWIHGREAVSSFDLRVGDRLILSPEGPLETRERQATPEEAPFRVAVVGGRLAGTRIALASGEHVLGRGEGATVVIDDASLAEEQVRIRVAPDGVHLSRAADIPETFVDEEPLDGERSVEPGQLVRAGRTLLVFERREPREPPPPGRDGLVPFNRPPQARPRLAPQRLEAPEPPTQTQGVRIPLPAMLLPLAGGVGLFLFTKNPASLVFAVLSPLMAGWNFVADRRRGKSSYGKRTQDFRQKLAELKESLARARTAELRARRRIAPDAAELVDRAQRIRPELWERRPEDDEFLALRLGTADRPALLEIDTPRRGDDDLVAQVDEIAQPYRTVKDVPVVLPLGVLGATGVSGSPERVAAHGRWLAFQAAALHSPRDLVLCGAIAREHLGDWEWLKWLPHTRAAASPLETHLAADPITARSLLEELSKLLEERRSQRAQAAGRSRQLPAVLVVLDEALAPERALVGPLLADGGEHGIAVLWLGTDVRALPGECRAVVEIDAEGALKLTDTSSGEVVENVTADELGLKLARDSAVALAPVVDVSATGGRGRLPREVSLVELLGLEKISSSAVAGRWRTYDGHRSARLGAATEAPFEVDLVRDGPHALIGGTTGSGKSELLQTFVSSLAATTPPDRLNFLLIDYKGGAAFKDCVALPHTVGFVTDLDAHLTNRARVSLDAELKRREELLRGAGAKDLGEMERRDPGHAPPSLVIVVDEFATLANEIPEFVDGLVDVAQRGRTLGLHLVLATQRPRGAITDNIRANTNLRIAMRMADAAESQDVIGVPEAATIPRSQPGRGYAVTGHGELTEFQAAYVGGRSAEGGTDDEVTVADFGFAAARQAPAEHRLEADTASDLHQLVEAASGAADDLGIPPQSSPWLPPLPDVVPLATIATGDAGQGAALGLVDEPELQSQRVLSFDPERDGSLLVYGTSGSGKTTLLRTLAVSLASQSTPEELHIYGLDFATRGLAALEGLPHCGAVVAGEDGERVARLFSLASKAIAGRKELVGRDDPAAQLPRIVILLDGYAAFTAAYDRVDAGELVDALPRLVSDGRTLGVHFAVAVERRGAVRSALTSVIQNRIVLRMADDEEYAALGIEPRMFRGVRLQPGRGFAGRNEVQCALVGDNPGTESSAVTAAGERLRERDGEARAPALPLLPTEVPRSEMPTAERPLEAFIGLSDESIEPVSVAIDEGHFLVAGPRRSGRSTTLETIARSLHDASPSLALYLAAPRRSPLPALEIWTSAASGLQECEALLSSLAERVGALPAGGEPIVLVVDDGNELTDGKAASALETIARRGRDLGVSVVAATEAQAAHRTFGGWLRELRNEEHGLLLMPQIDVDGDLFGVRLPRRSATSFPPGRGYLVQRGRIELVQVAG